MKAKRPVLTSWDSIPIVLDIGYAAMVLGVSIETVRKACVAGTLPAFKINDLWRINKKDLMIFCRENVE